MESSGTRDRVLVIDDEPGIARMIQVFLESRGLSTLVAHSGREALEFIAHQPVDLVLLDIRMPGLDGYAVLRALRGDGRFQHLPVILVTAKDAVKDKVEGLELGADDYITKPFDNEELLARIKTQLRIQRVGRELLRRNRELTAFNAITQAINRSLELSEILNSALDTTLEVLGAEGGIIRLLDEATGELYVVAHRGRSEAFLKERVRVKPEDTLLVLLQGKGEAVVITDLWERGEPFFHLAKVEGYRAYAGILLLARDRMVGILAVLSRTPGRFKLEDIRFLTAIGHHIGLGIENARLFKERSRLAITDELTGLYNHRHFYRVLQTEVSRALRYQRHLSLIMLDIDHFKRYNDRWGHLAGDKALREVAGVLRRSVRDVDTVARYGGEEFAIILPETELRQAAIQAERIRAAVERQSFREPLTISLGVAAFARGMQKGEELVQEADRALYRAKAEGRNRVCLAQPSG